MRTIHLYRLTLVAGLGVGGATGAQGVADAPLAQVAWQPQVPRQGALVVIGVRVPAEETVGAVQGDLAGEPLHFERVAGWFRAVGAVPLDAQDSVPARVVIERAGASDTLTSALPVRPRRARHEQLRADPAFVQPPESLAPRIQAERELVRELKQRAHDTPRLWQGRFVRPRPGKVASGFGVARIFNGTVRSRHLGVDFPGRRGAPVRAANRGVVTYTGELYFSGTTVFLDHGGGLVTAYLHLSRVLVTPGDTVSPGQLIGRVGASGRATGPHLHWLAAYGSVAVDPLDLLTIDLAVPLASGPGRAQSSSR